MLFLGFVIALVILRIKRLTARHEPGSKGVDETYTLGVAKLRYAKGEISREEFEQIKEDLSWAVGAQSSVTRDERR